MIQWKGSTWFNLPEALFSQWKRSGNAAAIGPKCPICWIWVAIRATKLHQLDRQSQQHRPWPHSLHGFLLKIWGPLASPPKFPGLQETIELKRQTVHRTTPSSLEPSELDKLLAARLKSRYTYHFERTLKNRVSIYAHMWSYMYIGWGNHIRISPSTPAPTPSSAPYARISGDEPLIIRKAALKSPLHLVRISARKTHKESEGNHQHPRFFPGFSHDFSSLNS